jgi:hypothetical protein
MYCHVLAARIAGEPPAFRGKPRFCEKDSVRRRKEKNDEKKQQTNGKPWRSRITLRLKPPDVLPPRLQTLQTFVDLSWLTERQRHLTPGRGHIHKWLFTDGPVWSALPTKDHQPSFDNQLKGLTTNAGQTSVCVAHCCCFSL